jgi:hypothetical protein
MDRGCGCGAILGIFLFVGAVFYLWNGITGQASMEQGTALGAVALIGFGVLTFAMRVRRRR